ncbi:MAG: hypothetical protein ACOCSQ_05975 [Planctomycetota bacterium]
MRGRTTGKIVTGVLAIILGLVAIYYIITADPDNINGFRAIAYAILSLTSTTAYRYFED